MIENSHCTSGTSFSGFTRHAALLVAGELEPEMKAFAGDGLVTLPGLVAAATHAAGSGGRSN